jgi:leader peptidase (prepilin peptidase)/N-methyltransferase
MSALEPAAGRVRVQARRGGTNAGGIAAATIVGLASLAVSPDLHGVSGAALGLMMLAVAASDYRRFLVPDALSGGAFALGIVDAALTGPEPGLAAAGAALARALCAAGLFMAIREGYRFFRGREGLGLGDVKLAAAAGAWLSVAILPVAVEIAAVAGLGFHLWRLCRRKRAFRARARIPFAAFFAPAIWLGWLIDAGLSGAG